MAHQYVCGFDVAMHNQIGVRMGHRIQDVKKKTYPGFDIQIIFAAVMVNRQTLHVLKNQVGMSRGGNARIKQLGNAWMGKSREDRALSSEPVLATTACQRKIQELDCDLAFESAIVSFGKPHGSHAAMANRGNERVSTDGLTSQLFPKRSQGRCLQEAFLFGCTVFLEENFKLLCQKWVLLLQ